MRPCAATSIEVVNLTTQTRDRDSKPRRQIDKPENWSGLCSIEIWVLRDSKFQYLALAREPSGARAAVRKLGNDERERSSPLGGYLP